MQVHGKIILGFPFGDKEIKQHCCDFYLSDDSHNFIIDIDEYPIEKAFELLCSNESIYEDCLFCYDENGNAFTIYECYIKPMQIPVKQMKIIWRRCLWGIILKILKMKR